MIDQPEIKVPIKHYYLYELAELYGTTKFRIRNEIKKVDKKKTIGKRIGNTYSPKQVKEIFNLLGHPVISTPKND